MRAPTLLQNPVPLASISLRTPGTRVPGPRHPQDSFGSPYNVTFHFNARLLRESATHDYPVEPMAGGRGWRGCGAGTVQHSIDRRVCPTLRVPPGTPAAHQVATTTNSVSYQCAQAPHRVATRHRHDISFRSPLAGCKITRTELPRSNRSARLWMRCHR